MKDSEWTRHGGGIWDSCKTSRPMPIQPIDAIAAALFAAALIHTFTTRVFERLARRHPRHAGLFHLLGEGEVVFGFWAIILIIAMALVAGGGTALAYAESRKFTEPLFVFVIMVVAASRPVLVFVQSALSRLARQLPGRSEVTEIWLGLALVPLVGSLITEPAAMTLAALTLAPRVFRAGMPEWKKYAALGVLFVNISIGGTLTANAAPPVLMVASAWNWDTAFMASEFGWKAVLAVLVNATAVTLLLAPNAPDLSAESRYMLVAGAVAGGGLTVIANAPNPAGVALLRRGFNDESIGAGGLLAGALAPTAVACVAFLLL